MNESDLLQNFVRSNDSESFRLLIERHSAMVSSICRSVLHESHDVQDAFQTTFLILARRAGTIKQTESIGPWLHRVALRVARRSRQQTQERRLREAKWTGPDTQN